MEEIVNTNLDKEKENIIIELNIKGYKYKFKDKYNACFYYRCIFRISWKLKILNSNEDYKKILDKDIENNEISYIINSKKKIILVLLNKKKQLILNLYWLNLMNMN